MPHCKKANSFCVPPSWEERPLRLYDCSDKIYGRGVCTLPVNSSKFLLNKLDSGEIGL